MSFFFGLFFKISSDIFSLDKILVENSNYQNRSSLKKRLIREAKLEYKCYQCGGNDEWNGKKLSLQLNHKNGINNDNRIENLREASYSENNANIGLRKTNKSGIKNICWNTAKNSWRVCVENKQLGIKYQKDFKDLELAKLVAIEARNKHHKEFASHS